MQKDVKVTGNRFLIPLDALKNLHSRTSCLQYFLGWYPDDQRSSSPLHDTHLGVRSKISCIKSSKTKIRYLLPKITTVSELEKVLMGQGIQEKDYVGFDQEQGYSSCYYPWLVEFLVFFGSWQPIVPC